MLLHRAQTLFNRPLYQYVNGVAEQKILCSTLLIELSELFSHTKNELLSIKDELSSYQLHSNLIPTTAGASIHESLAQELGFVRIQERNLFFVEERRSKEKIRGALREIQDACEQTLKFLSVDTNDTSDLSLALNSLSTKAQLIGDFKLPETNKIDLMEQSRADLQKKIFSAAQSLSKLQISVDTQLASQLKPPTAPSKIVIPKSTLLSATATMVNEGVAAQNAMAASAALVKYCSDHNVGPQEIIIGEISRVHPHLTTKSLESIKKHYIEAELSQDLTEEKKKNARSLYCSPCKISEKIRRPRFESWQPFSFDKPMASSRRVWDQNCA